MKNITLLLATFTLFSSCYSYKAYDPEIDGDLSLSISQPSKLSGVRDKSLLNKKEEVFLSPQENKKVEIKNTAVKKGETQKVLSQTKLSAENITVKSIIKEKGYYKVKVFDKSYKIEAVKWQGDTLYAHKKGKPKTEYKFSEKDIEDLKIRKFSKRRSDILTATSYVAGGVAVFLLLK